MPGFQVDGKGPFAASAALIDIAGSVVIDSEHRDQAIGDTVGTTNIRAGGSYFVDGKANAASGFGNQGTLLEGIVDTVNGIGLHVEQEAGGHLGVAGATVEEGGGGVGEPFLAHKVVGLEDRVEVGLVDTDGDTHKHVLGTFDDFSVHFEQVGFFEGFEPEKVVGEVPLVINFFFDFFLKN